MKQILACIVIALAFAALVQAQCPSTLNAAIGASQNYQWSPGADQGAVSYTICGFINTPCGVTPDNQCMTSVRIDPFIGKVLRHPAESVDLVAPPRLHASNCCGVCQTWVDSANGAQGACLGTTLSGVAPIPGGYSILYINGDSTDSGIGREVYVQLTCGGSSPASATQFQQAPEKPPPPHGKPYTYYLFVQSNAICGGGGLGGMIFIILLIVVAVIYFVAFAALNKFKNGAEGLDIIPHREFWAETPSLFVEGIMFVKSKVMGLFGREGYSTVS